MDTEGARGISSAREADARKLHGALGRLPKRAALRPGCDRDRMDEVDVQILADMAYRDGSYNLISERHPSSVSVARRLKIDEKTVRTRVRRMERDRFIKYYQARTEALPLGTRDLRSVPVRGGHAGHQAGGPRVGPGSSRGSSRCSTISGPRS